MANAPPSATSTAAVLEHIRPGTDVIVPAANGEPVTVLEGTVSRIQATLTPGAVVTTHKNLVDKVVTEYGVAELRGHTIRERAAALIAIAAPAFRDDLGATARRLGYL
jgi:4-hydroxybutyrate CoA-transferase